MPAHTHPRPACGQKIGLPCSPATCQHFGQCNHGGRLLQCEEQPDGSCHCFHATWEDDSADVAPVRHDSIDPRTIDPMGRAPKNYDWVQQRWLRHDQLAGPAIGMAYGVIEKFVQKEGTGMFPTIPRFSVAAELLDRVKNPQHVNQAANCLCGPAAFVHVLARQDPYAYTKFVTDLYDEGLAFVPGTPFPVKPSAGFLADSRPLDTEAVDWIALGSLRDSESWFFQYHRNSALEHFRGGSLGSDIASWFRQFGYREVVNKTTLLCSDLDNLILANKHYARNYRVVLFVSSTFQNAQTHKGAKAGSSRDHFIVLSGPIDFGPPIKFKFFTWGSYINKMEWPLTKEEFLNSYYGFVAARR